jgi:sugar-specific transcriptional regulator TrmB
MKILTSEEKNALQKAGLSASEQSIYLYLLEYGDQNPTEISHATRTLRPNTYALLKTLVHKGFVERIKQHKRFIYRAKEPVSLLSIFAEQKKMFETVIPTLELLRYKEENKPSVRIFEGFDQIKNIYEESLLYDKVFAIASTEKLLELHPQFFKNYWLALKVKGIFFKDILTFGSGAEAAGEMKEILKAYYDYRLLPSDSYDFTNEVVIYGNTVSLISYSNHLHAVTIKDPETAKTFKAIFDTLWSSL